MNLFSKKMTTILLVCIVALFSSINANAQNSDEPIITFKTNIYNTYGATNYFSLVIGSNAEDSYIDVDCGFGKVEYEVEPAVYNEETGGITGTFIGCTVSADGIVKIYGDASQIDYINASGCYIEWIEFPKLTNLDILDLSHNELKRLDLSNQTKLRALYLSDNSFSRETPLVVGNNKPDLTILEVSIIDHMDSSFNLSDYPNMVSFDGYHNISLTKIDPTGCPNLQRLTLDVTNVETVDVSQNPDLLILNVSETKVTSIDTSNNPLLRELYCSHRGSYNNEYKLESLDISKNPEIVYLFCSGNKLTELDLSNNEKLTIFDASDNYLSEIDLSNCPNLYQVYLNLNCFDFSTLPQNPGTWNTYYYKQREIELDKSYPVNHTLDLSERVIRDETTTTAAVYSISESNPGEPTLLDSSHFNYNNGRIKFLKAHSDSIYIAFSNSLFDENQLITRKFMIKTVEEFGKPNKVFSFSSNIEQNESVAFGVGIETASVDNPINFFVNFGDGELVQCTATSESFNGNNVIGIRNGYGNIEIFTPEGVTITAISIDNIEINNIDLSKLGSLRELSITNAELYSIDLIWNRCLKSINLSGNNLSFISLEGANGDYGKNVLADINLSFNKLQSITLNDLRAIRNLNLSNNQLSERIDFGNGDYINSINLSHNMMTEFDFSNCYDLTKLDISFNNASSVTLPTVNNLKYFACNNNKMTIATLPHISNISSGNYIYAPQSDLIIASKGPGIDLSSQYRMIDNNSTSYIWKKASGEVLTEGIDYEFNDGITNFINIEVGKIYCEMSHPSFPDFKDENVFKTTLIEPADMPANVIATFTTTKDNENVVLSLAAVKSGTAIYIDWKGDNVLSQYLLEDTYKLFDAVTKANTDVKVYTYDEEDEVSVFSMSGASLSNFDASKLTKATNISVNNAGLSDIKLPEGSINLKEISLENNQFTSFDLSKFPELTMVSLTGNLLKTLNLADNKKLEVVSAAYNQLSDISLDNNSLWALYIDHNEFVNINLDGVPNLTQFSISNNLLTDINVENLHKLIMLVINNNYLTFETLPLHNENYVIYYYSNQAPISVSEIDGKVDLSSQLYVNENETQYRWFVGVPSVDTESGELIGTELQLGVDYTLEDGVTTFLNSFENIMCVMTNYELPDVFIYTTLMNVESSVNELIVNDNITVYSNNSNIIVKSDNTDNIIKVYSIDGQIISNKQSNSNTTIINGVSNGIYVVKVNDKSFKVLVK